MFLDFEQVYFVKWLYKQLLCTAHANILYPLNQIKH